MPLKGPGVLLISSRPSTHSYEREGKGGANKEDGVTHLVEFEMLPLSRLAAFVLSSPGGRRGHVRMGREGQHDVSQRGSQRPSVVSGVLALVPAKAQWRERKRCRRQ